MQDFGFEAGELRYRRYRLTDPHLDRKEPRVDEWNVLGLLNMHAYTPRLHPYEPVRLGVEKRPRIRIRRVE